jgi:hypothetical protein
VAEALLVVLHGAAQGVDVVDGEEGVFVDGVAVVAVANDQRVDAVELGDEHLQNAEGVHGAQGVGGVGAEQDFAEVVPEIGALGDVDGEDGERVGDAVFSGLGEGVAVVGDEGEDAQHAVGVCGLGNCAPGRCRCGPGSSEKSVPGWGAALAELLVEADGRGQMLHEEDGAAVDGARVAVVGAHPVGGVGGAAGFEANGVGGGFVLGLPVERVVVAAVAEVEKTSGGGEEIEGCFGVSVGGLPA